MVPFAFSTDAVQHEPFAFRRRQVTLLQLLLASGPSTSTISFFTISAFFILTSAYTPLALNSQTTTVFFTLKHAILVAITDSSSLCVSSRSQQTLARQNRDRFVDRG
jgi:hypothetical protein